MVKLYRILTIKPVHQLCNGYFRFNVSKFYIIEVNLGQVE